MTEPKRDSANVNEKLVFAHVVSGQNNYYCICELKLIDHLLIAETDFPSR